MALKAVVFDVGETLVDETRTWERAADAAGVPRFTVMGVLGGLAARGEPHSRVWEILGVARPEFGGLVVEWYPDALDCLADLRKRGCLVGAAGNTPAEVEAELRPHVDLVGSSHRWRVEKPDSAFFGRLVDEVGVDPGEIAYVGDRVDNDIVPALRAGMVAFHIRRGPWGHLHEPPAAAHRIRMLSEVLEALERV